MPDSDPVTARPFTTFNFRVRISVDGSPLCEAAFAECDGLEMTMEPETRREGGNHVAEYQLVGSVSYGRLTLRRGMTETFDLWDWFTRVSTGEYSLRPTAVVELLSSDRAGEGGTASSVNARFELFGCLPVQLRAPSLNAGDGGVAIEELQIAYERLSADIPNAASGGGEAGPRSPSGAGPIQ